MVNEGNENQLLTLNDYRKQLIKIKREYNELMTEGILVREFLIKKGLDIEFLDFCKERKQEKT